MWTNIWNTPQTKDVSLSGTGERGTNKSFDCPWQHPKVWMYCQGMSWEVPISDYHLSLRWLSLVNIAQVIPGEAVAWFKQATVHETQRGHVPPIFLRQCKAHKRRLNRNILILQHLNSLLGKVMQPCHGTYCFKQNNLKSLRRAGDCRASQIIIPWLLVQRVITECAAEAAECCYFQQAWSKVMKLHFNTKLHLSVQKGEWMIIFV